MMEKSVALLLCVVAVAAALPHEWVLSKLSGGGARYAYVRAGDGAPHLVDTWLKASDVAAAARFNPDRQNVYHLFTRQNPSVSQPLLVGNAGLLGMTNYNPARRTVLLLHGWLDSATADFNTVLVPAFLAAEDLNVIVVDWSAGAATINYLAAVANTVPSGESVARFVTWLNQATGATPAQYHVVGHSLGAHGAGVVGRNTGGQIAYITGLDAAFPGWVTNENKLRRSDGIYTEAIHTNAGVLGYANTLADVDFYPNGGIDMPGCSTNECDHARSFFYFAETLTHGGFTGRRCLTVLSAMTGNCHLIGNLRMGGLVPKTGQTGIFHMLTNEEPPFSRG